MIDENAETQAFAQHLFEGTTVPIKSGQYANFLREATPDGDHESDESEEEPSMMEDTFVNIQQRVKTREVELLDEKRASEWVSHRFLALLPNPAHDVLGE